MLKRDWSNLSWVLKVYDVSVWKVRASSAMEKAKEKGRMVKRKEQGEKIADSKITATGKSIHPQWTFSLFLLH